MYCFNYFQRDRLCNQTLFDFPHDSPSLVSMFRFTFNLSLFALWCRVVEWCVFVSDFRFVCVCVCHYSLCSRLGSVCVGWFTDQKRWFPSTWYNAQMIINAAIWRQTEGDKTTISKNAQYLQNFSVIRNHNQLSDISITSDRDCKSIFRIFLTPFADLFTARPCEMDVGRWSQFAFFIRLHTVAMNDHPSNHFDQSIHQSIIQSIIFDQPINHPINQSFRSINHPINHFLSINQSSNQSINHPIKGVFTVIIEPPTLRAVPAGGSVTWRCYLANSGGSVVSFHRLS